MKKWLRNIGLGSVIVAITLTTFMAVGNTKSYAAEKVDKIDPRSLLPVPDIISPFSLLPAPRGENRNLSDDQDQGPLTNRFKSVIERLEHNIKFPGHR